MGETILLMEDDKTLLRASKGILEMKGYQVLACAAMREAREAVWEQTPSMMVLDVMLPDGNGMEFCREYRADYGAATPVLFLTVLDKRADMLAGYKAGGTDYLVKPFSLHMLVLKVQALLENNRAAAGSVIIGSLRLDCPAKIACVDGEDLLLTPKEYSVLEYLARNRSRYVTGKELYEEVWGAQAMQDCTVKQHIYHVRDKLGKRGAVDIVSRRGVGYRLIRTEGR